MNNLFAKWYLNICATATGIFLAYYFGFIQLVWESDQTKITSVIAVLWFIATAMIWRFEFGYKARVHGKPVRFHTWSPERMKRVKFVSETCSVLGMIGTVIGFIIMAQTSGLADANSTEALKQAVHVMLAGFGVAMFTTLVGALAKLSIDSQIVTRS